MGEFTSRLVQPKSIYYIFEINDKMENHDSINKVGL